MTKFFVDLLDSAGALLAEGPIKNVISASATERLDEIGSISVDLPATDTATIDQVSRAAQMRLSADDGYTVTGLIRSTVTTINGHTPVVRVSGPDLLAELAAYTCGFDVFYRTDQGGGIYGDDINSIVIPNLLSGTGWSAGSIDASLGLFLGSLDALSRLAALQTVRQRVGKHVRAGSTPRTLDFGTFGASSGYRLANVPRVTVAQDANADLIRVRALDITTDYESVVNLLIPFGAGEWGKFSGSPTYFGKVRLADMSTNYPSVTDVRVKPGPRGAQTTTASGSTTTNIKVTDSSGFTAGRNIFIGDETDAINGSPNIGIVSQIFIASVPDATTIVLAAALSGAPAAGLTLISNPQYYIYDATAYAANPREATLVFNDVVVPYPTTTANVAQFVPAGKALYDRATAYLAEHKTPQSVYRVTPIAVPADLRVGQTVALDYHGAVTRNGVRVEWVDVQTDLHVIGITRTYSGSGATSAALQISDVARSQQSDGAMLAGLMASTGVISTRT